MLCANLVAIVVCYYRDIRKLKRRLTFTGVDTIINQLEQHLYENVFRPEAGKRIKKNELIKELYAARELIVKHHHSLYLNRLDSLIHKVKIFGTHFASLDIRQDSRIHTAVLLQINKVFISKNE